VVILAAALLLTSLLVAAGCSPAATNTTETPQEPVAQPANPLVPANTAQGTVDKANTAVNELQNQVNQTP
jgi:hypothetical protein